MSALAGLTFAPMLVTDVFESMKASSAWYDKANLASGEGQNLYLSQTQSKNSVAAIVADQDVAPEPGNCVTITLKTQATFYQPSPFYTAQNFLIFRHSLLDERSGLLLTAALRRAMEKFSWGYGVSMARLRKTRIMVPVTVGGDGERVVDWNGMKSFGGEVLEEAISLARASRASIDADDALPELTFAPMFITDVFESMRASSAAYDKSKLSGHGKVAYPFVSRTRASNGIDGFCPRQDKEPEPDNAITVGLDTQTVGYQPAAFYTSQNIQVLRHENLSIDSGLVLATLLVSQMGKFSWGGNGATLGRLRKTQIMVPVATGADGEQVVDWDGITRYGRALRTRADRATNAALKSGATR